MEQNSQNEYRLKLFEQIKEAFGKIIYSFTTHEKMSKRLKKLDSRIKIWQIILSAITSVSFISLIIVDGKISAIIGSIFAGSLLVLNSLSKSFSFIQRANNHIKAADSLWLIREDYISLLTDFKILTNVEIIKQREELKMRTSLVYQNAERTDSKSYKEAQKALQLEEEQTFKKTETSDFLHKGLKND